MRKYKKYRRLAGIAALSLLLVGSSACRAKATDATTESDAAVTMATLESESETDSDTESKETGKLEVNGSEAEGTTSTSTAATTEAISDVQRLADEVKTAVANKDLEALADLIAYPIGIVSPDGEGIEVANKEEFLKLKEEDLFSDRLLRVIADVDTANMDTDKDDLAIMGKGTINIALGLTEEGSMKVVAISR
ncbi:MAG: hypothetical protein Q4D90_03490 [bacterium]|nr:hypothetical protein [bacterium]